MIKSQPKPTAKPKKSTPKKLKSQPKSVKKSQPKKPVKTKESSDENLYARLLELETKIAELEK